MFREMRRNKQMLSNEECIDILHTSASGVLAVSGDDDYPYAVPLNYVYRNNRIYFHGAKVGHKLDGIRRNEKVSFCIIDKDDVIQEKLTTYFRSVIVFGKARILEKKDEKWRALEILSLKYSPDNKENIHMELEKSLDFTSIIEIQIELISGKQSKYLFK